MEQNELSPRLILQNLKTRFIGQKIIYYPVISSTMDAARTEAQWGSVAGTIILAGEQTEGKGRLQRKWISTRGNLSFSLILRPNIDLVPGLIMMASLAVASTIEKLTGLKTQIKWPNDVLIKDKKVSGILIQNEIFRSNLKYSIIGIGINVNLHVKDYPEIAPLATSLSDELGKELSLTEVICHLLTEIETLYEKLPERDYLYHQWKSRMYILGQNIYLYQGDQVIPGRAESVGKDGSLIMRNQEGKLIRILAGDVSLRLA